MNQTPADQPSDSTDDRASDVQDDGLAEGDEPQSGGFIWQIIPVLMLIIMGLLAMSLYRRVAMVDPVRRCADAFESSYNPTDTMLSDRIKVRTPDRAGHTTCGQLRASGALHLLPKRNQMKKTMPS